MSYLVRMQACCPTRYQMLRVEAEDVSEARRKALKHCNKGILHRKGWRILRVREEVAER